MSLISCPNCGQSISDKAKVCPKCSYGFSNNSTVVHTVTCKECHTEYIESLDACPKCGCPTPDKKRKIKKTVIIIAIISIVVCILGISINKNFKEYVYHSNLSSAAYTMHDGAAEAKRAGNLIMSVWYNAIHKEKDEETDKFTMVNGVFVDDFNDALGALYSDADFRKKLSEIQDNQEQVIGFIKRLKNPPKEYEEAYGIMQDYYDNYFKLTNMVVHPKGSYNSFSEDFNTYDTKTVNAYDKMRIYID